MSDAIELCLSGLAAHQAGRWQEAEGLYRAALVMVPDEARILHCLGLLLLTRRRPREAARCWRGVLATRPDDVAALVNLANALCVVGDGEAAAEACEAALACAPRNAAAWMTLGRARLTEGRVADAVAAYQQATALTPDDPRAQAGLSAARLRSGDPAAALDGADRALGHDAAVAEAHDVRGCALTALGRPAEAVAAFRRALAIAPEDAGTHLNLGNALLDLDARDAAETAMRRALALAPDLAEAHASLGYLLSGDGRLDEAIASCAEAIRLRPHLAQAHWNQSFAYMLNGDYGPGWEKYEWRKRHDRFARDFLTLPGPEWAGEDIGGRTILVQAEQGLGDTIQFARYLPILAARGARVITACAACLRELLGPLCDTVDRAAPLPAYDVWIDQMSLPRVFGTRVDSVPSARGYLRADPARVAHWGRLLPPAPRVGVVWSGNPAHSNDARRSMPARALAPIMAVAGCQFVNLQVGPRSGEIDVMFGVADRSDALTDFAETAAAVSVLDLVIAVDTSVAHLAGALGVATWVMLPSAPDWRWMAERTDSPWYASITLFRQSRAGDWDELAGRVARALVRWRDARPSPQAATRVTSAGAMLTSAA